MSDSSQLFTVPFVDNFILHSGLETFMFIQAQRGPVSIFSLEFVCSMSHVPCSTIFPCSWQLPIANPSKLLHCLYIIQGSVGFMFATWTLIHYTWMNQTHFPSVTLLIHRSKRLLEQGIIEWIPLRPTQHQYQGNVCMFISMSKIIASPSTIATVSRVIGHLCAKTFKNKTQQV